MVGYLQLQYVYLISPMCSSTEKDRTTSKGCSDSFPSVRTRLDASDIDRTFTWREGDDEQLIA